MSGPSHIAGDALDVRPKPLPPTLYGADAKEVFADLNDIVQGRRPFHFCFQPIADMTLGTVAGYEVLVRFSTRAQLSPDKCFAAADLTGQREHLEALVLQRSFAAKKLLPPDTFLSLNVSPSFLISPLCEEILASQKSLERIIIEITEDVSIGNYALVRTRVAQIRAKGGLLAIDDAGAGYASLTHVIELVPNFIKLDRAIISHCDEDRTKSVLIEMMGAAGNRMDAWLIAEGVETAGELAELLRLGVPLAQGYHLGRPETQMRELLPDARQLMLQKASGRARSSDLLLLAEPCPKVSTKEEAEALVRTRSSRIAAVVDRWERPIMLVDLVDAASQQHTRTQYEFMRCQISGDLSETLRRALTRAQPIRFDPVVLIDESGRLQGIARIDQLTHHLLGSALSLSAV